MIIHHKQILGVILCGGRNSRMDHMPKWELSLGGSTIMEKILTRLTPQVDNIVLNGSDDSLTKYSLPLTTDSLAGFQGPLAGILSGLEYAEKNHYQWIATCPCDTPYFPMDIVQQLKANAEKENTYCNVIQHQERIQGTFGLWHISIKKELQELLTTTDIRSIHYFLKKYQNYSTVTINDNSPSLFFNINTPKEWQEAQLTFKNKPE